MMRSCGMAHPRFGRNLLMRLYHCWLGHRRWACDGAPSSRRLNRPRSEARGTLDGALVSDDPRADSQNRGIRAPDWAVADSCDVEAAGDDEARSRTHGAHNTGV